MTEVSKKTLARRRQVAAAVKRWRENHREAYNKYSREYLQRPGPREKHRARCRRYRMRMKLLSGVDDVVVDVSVPPVEIYQESGSGFVPVL